MIRIFFFLFGFFFLAVNSWADTYTKDTSIVYVSTSGLDYPSQLCDASCPPIPGCGSGTLYRVSKGGEASYNCPTSRVTVSRACTSGGSVCDIFCRYTCQSLGACSEYNDECESAGGTFTGTTVSDNGQDCCRGSCNVCGSNAMKKLYEAKKKVCCENGMAPPDQNQTCSTVSLPTSGCGMVWSTYGDFTSGGWSCADPSSGFEAGSRYAKCFDDDDPNGSSSSGGGSSSSGGSSGQYGDCQECPWLDSILDTLTAQKQKVNDIYVCLVIPGMCGQQNQDSLTVPEWVREKMDVIISWDSAITHNTKSTDSVVKKISDFLPSILQSDSITREEITEGLKSLDTSVRSINDTTAHYLTHVANVIGASENELSAHLDSIIKHIPDTLLDSILKYQKYSIDIFDSLGDGFAKIDDLTDSAIKYFKEGYRFDSIYNTQYRDSLGAIHGAIENLSGSIEGVGDKILYGLGYGDTASSTLRDELRGYFTGASVDTHGVNYGSNWVANGERMGDSIVNSLGWGGIRGMNIDSVYSHALDGSRMDSVSQSIDDSLSGVAANLNDSLAARTDSLKRQLPTVLDSMADSLVIWAPFADFDSIIYSTIGAHIPNRSDCPEDCQKWTVSIPIIGLYSYTVDFGLCLGRATFGGLSVLGFLKLLIRVIVAFACIMTAYKVLVRMI